MATKIKMGNDEFILYIRKTSKCSYMNDTLGRLIYEWLKIRDAIKLYNEKAQPCMWGNSALNMDALHLPEHATQFEFDRKLLPELYDYLDELGSN